MKKTESVPQTRQEAFLQEVRQAASKEIAAYEQAKEKIVEIEALRNQYKADAEKFQGEIDREPPVGLAAGEIKSYLTGKNLLREKLADMETTLQEVEHFFSEATKQLAAAKEALRGPVEAVIGKHHRARTTAVYDDHVAAIQREKKEWEFDLAEIRKEKYLQGVFMSGSLLELEIDLDRLMTDGQKMSATLGIANAMRPVAANAGKREPYFGS